MLRSKFFSAEQVEAIVRDFRTAGLEPAEVAMMEYAVKVSTEPYKVLPRDIEMLRGHGYSDAEIVDIAAVAAARNFISRLVDALGAEPDVEHFVLEDHLKELLAVGRPLKR
ncbi:MAG TPA: hypothetical protein VJA65_03205 [bacterium]|nr:hypothetical protein [bacterium]